jgi:protein TIF31
VVIDYRGYRVTAQSIIPGILEREQEQSVVYGSIDFGKTVVTHPKYLELLGKAGQQLKVFQHSVLNDKDEEVELCSSVECKGIIGNDGRHYILDLLRTFPPDVNFLKIEGEEMSKEARALGFPVEHKHKLCCLRQELVDAFVESRYMLFIKYAAFHLQQVGLKKQKTASERSGSIEKETIKSEEADIAAVQSTSEKGTEEQQQLNSDEAKKIVESITESITHGEKPDVEESTKVI